MTKIEMTRVYRTRDGREVRIYAVDGGGTRPVHGAVLMGDSWRQERWTINGDWAPEDMAATLYDLIEVRPRIKRKVWVNVYRHEDGIEFEELWETKHAADAARGDACIACVRLTIDCEEGEGL